MSNQQTTPTGPAPQPQVTTPAADAPVQQLVDMPATPPAAPRAAPPAPAPPAPAPPVAFAPRPRFKKSDERTSAPGLSTMLEMSASAPWSVEEDRSLNTFVPNFHALAHATAVCNDLMSSTYRFTRAHPHWIPAMTTVYSAMLFYFRILDCMVESGYPDSKMVTLLRFIKNSYDFRSLVIPGPLVPYFESLSYCLPDDSYLGNISPAFQASVPAYSDTFWSLEDPTRYELPNVLALLDYPTWLAGRARADRTPDDSERYFNHRALNLHSVAPTAANSPSFINCFCSPGFYDRFYENPEVENNFSNSARLRLRLPPRINQAAVNEAAPHSQPSWLQFLRLKPLPGEAASPNFRSWFGNLASMMSDYSAYFSESRTLADLPVSAGGQPHVTLLYEPTSPDQTTPSALPTFTAAVPNPDDPDHPTPAFVSIPLLSSLACTGKLITEDLPTVHIQMATISQINARTAGHENDDREGEHWTSHRVVHVMTKFDYFPNVPAYIALLHAETSIKKL